jgi:hypothetical protein
MTVERGLSGGWFKSSWLRALFGFVVLAFCAAPVPGDVGGCDQRAEELDPEIFLATKGGIDCSRCEECSLGSGACTRACQGVVDVALPRGCVPLVHDGEACLRRLLDASCDEYREFMLDEGPSTPTECNFCPRSEP